MARSAEALTRRAEKRSRPLEEQARVDATSAKKSRKLSEKGQEVNKALTEPGAWKCPSCGNQNFPSRYICNSKTCNESKPESAILESQQHRAGGLGPPSWTTSRRPSRPPPPMNKKPKRHDPETSKCIDWTKPQASDDQIEHNKLLRQRLKDNDPTLQGDDLERAKILVARDERKKQNKSKIGKSKKGWKGSADDDQDSGGGSSSKNSSDNSKNKDSTDSSTKVSKKERQKANKLLLRQMQEGQEMSEADKKRAEEVLGRKANKTLMKTYVKTGGGKGMTQEDATRAQNLLARKERKQQRRLQEGGNRKQ